jgi:hypothetical protein
MPVKLLDLCQSRIDPQKLKFQSRIHMLEVFRKHPFADLVLYRMFVDVTTAQEFIRQSTAVFTDLASVSESLSNSKLKPHLRVPIVSVVESVIKHMLQRIDLCGTEELLKYVCGLRKENMSEEVARILEQEL